MYKLNFECFDSRQENFGHVASVLFLIFCILSDSHFHLHRIGYKIYWHENACSFLLVHRKIFIQDTILTSDVETGYSRGSLLGCSPDAVYPVSVLHGLLHTLQENYWALPKSSL
jgi:hypothetical protein